MDIGARPPKGDQKARRKGKTQTMKTDIPETQDAVAMPARDWEETAARLFDCSAKFERENARLREQLYSARYILAECGASQLSEISGLPEGVVVSALENILSNTHITQPHEKD